MLAEPGSKRGQAMAAARRVASAYRTNREELEPVMRLLADVLALAALALRRRATPAETTTKGDSE